MHARRTATTGAALLAAALLVAGCGSDGGGDKDDAARSSAGSGADGGGDGEQGADGGAENGKDATGGSGGDGDGDGPGGSDGSGDTGGSEKEGAAKPVTRQVVFEVTGEGTVSGQIMYGAGDLKTVRAELPWKESTTVKLEGAYRTQGMVISVIPPALQGADGMTGAASCTITVDGKKVADNENGKTFDGCQHTLK